MTLDIYGHLWEQDEEHTRTAIDDVFKRRQVAGRRSQVARLWFWRPTRLDVFVNGSELEHQTAGALIQHPAWGR